MPIDAAPRRKVEDRSLPGSRAVQVMDSAADRSPCAWLERLVVFEYTRAAQRGVQPLGGGVAFLDCLDPRGLVLDLPACGLEERFHSLPLDDDHAIGMAN